MIAQETLACKPKNSTQKCCSSQNLEFDSGQYLYSIVPGAPAEPGSGWRTAGGQLWVLHLTSVHGKPGQDQTGPRQVSTSLFVVELLTTKANHKEMPCPKQNPMTKLTM